MEVCMILYSENDTEAIYLFGDPDSERRGVMRIDKADPGSSEIIKMPDDDSVSFPLARGAIARLIRKARDGDYPEKLGYCPGW